ncbi:hypothetical protein Tco_1471800, partial [Tanacetum coccineum]
AEVVPHLKMGYQRALMHKLLMPESKLAATLNANITPSIRKHLEELKEKQRKWRVLPSGYQVVKVRKRDEAYGVNLIERTCDCRLWSTMCTCNSTFLHFKLNPDDGVRSWVGRVIACQNCQKTDHNKASCKDPKAPKPSLMKPPRAPTVCETSRQGEARGEKVAASRNVSASGAKGGSGAKCGSGKKGEASKSISARGAKSGASKSASGAKGGASKSARGAKSGASKSASGAKGGASKSVSASGAKSVSAKRGAASGAKVTKRGAAKSNSAHSSMNTKEYELMRDEEAARQVMQEEMEEEERRRLIAEEEQMEYQYNLEMEYGHFSDNENDRPATISELQALEEAHVQHNADLPSVSHGSASLQATVEFQSQPRSTIMEAETEESQATPLNPSQRKRSERIAKRRKLTFGGSPSKPFSI